ncbi:MAG: DAK2 domain-containing protein, partial [Albidovulum sp.]|nr:DAK2 domain-containing protein [Albidovulum sp.]
MTKNLISRLIAKIADSICASADDLTKLDQAIGDGDHGINMRRGVEALLKQGDDISRQDFSTALRKAGTAIVMSVGGASGPLYGSALLAMAKTASSMPSNQAEVGVVVAAGIDAVKA